jgi:uncharacterized protein
MRTDELERKRRASLEKRYIIVLVIFYLFVGPGPAIFFINPYTVTLVPPICFGVLAYLFRKEIAEFDYNSALKNKDTYRWMYDGLRYGIYAHALNTIILLPWMDFEAMSIITEDLLGLYPVFPVYLASIGPMYEEVVYRKIIFGELAKKISFWPAASISSLIFAVGHLAPERIPAYFALGLVLCWVYRRSGSIVPVFLAHIAINVLALAANTIR